MSDMLARQEEGQSNALLSPRAAGRAAGALFLASGVLSIPIALFVDRPGLMLLVSAGAAITGAIALRVPWHRWPRGTTLVMLVPAFVLMIVGNELIENPYSYGGYFVLLFMWVGLAQPSWTTVKVVPLAIGAFLAPELWSDPPALVVQALVVVVPVWIVVGETLAWTTARVRSAEMADVRRAREMESLLAASVLLARQTDAGEAARLVAGLAARLVGGSGGLVLLAEGRGLRTAGHHHWDSPPERLPAEALDPAMREALGTGQITRLGVNQLLIPLRSAAEPLGLVIVAFAPGRSPDLDPFVADMVVTFATQVTLTFERLTATRQLIDQTRLDPLTGIGNRREADAALRKLEPGDAVVIIDLDRFKRVNDERGHAEGDRVLVELATFLQRFVRDGDCLARFGGEEFLIVLHGVGARAGQAVTRILEGWRKRGPVTTFSAGVALHGANDDPTDTMRRADEAMYRAKRAGRNQVMVDTPPADPPPTGPPEKRAKPISRRGAGR